MKRAVEDARSPLLAWAVVVSFVLHAALAGALVAARAPKPRPRPPTFRVNLMAAPPGASAVGVVAPTAAPAPAPAAPPPPPARNLPPANLMKPPPTKAPPKKLPPAKTLATPLPPAPAPPKNSAPQPVAGGGENGGRGADVANVKTEGVEFPFPAYLENVVRSIAQRFHPQGNVGARAEVMFIIRRDGSIVPSSMQFVTRSGNFAFDLDAQGAIEDAGRSKAFGPLPDGFPDDVLPVVFSFDPRILH